MPTPTLTIWGGDDCRRLHDATMTLLGDVGVEIRQEERSPGLSRELGAGVEGTRVRLDSRLVRAALGGAPREWPPKPGLALQVCCDLARFYGLPSFSYAGHSEAKASTRGEGLDEQWSAEAALTMMLGAL
jgi:trimethylamine:corrinoid methyltransferase-like protein